MPHKKKANEELSERQKKFNKKVATERVICERFYGRLKVKFRIMSSKYRNAREDYEKIFKLCVALTNYDIILHPIKLKNKIEK
jgi:DDE superfamily endonuclease